MATWWTRSATPLSPYINQSDDKLQNNELLRKYNSLQGCGWRFQWKQEPAIQNSPLLTGKNLLGLSRCSVRRLQYLVQHSLCLAQHLLCLRSWVFKLKLLALRGPCIFRALKRSNHRWLHGGSCATSVAAEASANRTWGCSTRSIGRSTANTRTVAPTHSPTTSTADDSPITASNIMMVPLKGLSRSRIVGRSSLRGNEYPVFYHLGETSH